MPKAQPKTGEANVAIQIAILFALGVDIVIGVVGVTISKENAGVIIGFCTLTFTSLLGLLQQQHAAVKREEVAGKTEEVAEKVSQVSSRLLQTEQETTLKLNGIVKEVKETKAVGEAVHVLVNSAMSTQLRISMVALKRVAELTKHPDDIAAAELAEKSFREQETKQAIVDANASKAKGEEEEVKS